MPTRRSDRQGRDRVAVPAFSPATVEFWAARLTARGHHHDSHIPTGSLSKARQEEARRGAWWSRTRRTSGRSFPLDQPPLRRDQISMEQPWLWLFLRGRPSGRSQSHAKIVHGLNSARSSFRGIRMCAHRCKIELCQSLCRNFVVVARQQASFPSVRPCPCDGWMIAAMISPSVRLMCHVLCNLEWTDQDRGTA